ncbi:MAG: KGK domain-containing protein [Actinomycetota bacterium]
MSDGFKKLDPISEHKDAIFSLGSSYAMLRVGELASILHEALLKIDLLGECNKLLEIRQRGAIPNNFPLNNKALVSLMSDEGWKCEILNLGSRDWQKGKIRMKIHLEFCPNEPEIEGNLPIVPEEPKEPESPLDDLRRQLNLDH